MRKKYIDLLRMMALFYMFFQHGVLTLLKDYTNPLIIFLNEIVPLCPSLFLFLCGFSIIFYYEKNKTEVLNNKTFLYFIKRGIILIIASSILFFIEFGFQLPDLLISSSILNTIGIFLIVSAVILKLPALKLSFITLLILFIGQVILFFILQTNNIKIYPLNIAYEPWIPTITFGFLGLIVGLVYLFLKDNEKNKKIFTFALFITGIVIFSYFSIKYGAFKILFNDTGRFGIERIFNNSFLPQNLFSQSLTDSFFNEYVWNYGFECFIDCIGGVFILFGFFYFLEKPLFKILPKNIFIPGRFAFFNYFFHLSVIAIFVVIFGFKIFTDFQFVIFLICLYIVSYLLSFVISRINNKFKGST